MTNGASFWKKRHTPRTLYARWPRDYWHAAVSIGRQWSAHGLHGYYLDFTNKTREGRCRQEEWAFPVPSTSLEGDIVPVSVAVMALGYFELWLRDGKPEHWNSFARCADWLVVNHRSCPGYCDGWVYSSFRSRLTREA